MQIVPPRLCKLLLLLLDQTFIHGKAPLTGRPDGAPPQPGRCAEHGTARHQNIGTRLHTQGGGGVVHAAIHFQQVAGAPLCPLFLEPAQLFQRRGHELLPAEAGLHAHHQHQIQLVEIRSQRLRISTGLDGQAHLAAQCLDCIDGLLDVVLALEVEVVQAGTRLDERLCVLQRVADHQVDIVECCGHPLVQAFQYRHAKADVGHKVAVHHVIMQHLRTGIQHHAAVCAKLIEISRKDRRTNDRHCVLYSPLFFRKITPSVLPEHLFWGRNAGRAWLLLVYMKTRKKSNPEPCFSRKSLKPAPVSIQNPFQNQKRPDRPARFRGTVWPRIQLTGFMLAGSSTGTG